MAALHWRGPDRQDSWRDGEIALCHSCLFLDSPSHDAKQPAVGDGVSVVADASLHNAEELRQSLGATRGVSQAEILRLGYIRWGGQGLLVRIRGEFALAAWDQRTRTLLLARDPMGIRPLFVARSGNEVGFASEPAALVRSTVRNPRLDPVAVCQVLMFGAVHDASRSIYADVRRVPPAHSLTIRANGESSHRFWDIDSAQVSDGLPDHPPTAMRDLIFAAVGDRLLDRPIGMRASGGLDSSTVACTADMTLEKREVPPVRVHGAVWADRPGFEDEAGWAALLMEREGVTSEHVQHFIAPPPGQPGRSRPPGCGLAFRRRCSKRQRVQGAA